MATTYNNLYLDIRRELKAAGVENAQMEARELVCYGADKSREQFVRDMPLYVADVWKIASALWCSADWLVNRWHTSSVSGNFTVFRWISPGMC